MFTTRLAPDDTARGSGDGGSVSKAWGSGRIVLEADGNLEYLVTIYNPGAETFTSAILTRSENGAAGETVATFFTGVSIRDRYIQLRGTVMVNRSIKAEQLVDEIRENPGAFYVSAHSADGATGVIRGKVE